MADDQNNKLVGIDTGTGGFDINNETWTYDSVEAGDAGLDPIPTNKTVNVDKTQRDLGTKVKRKIGQYLSDITSANDFPIVNADQQVDLKLTTTSGVPTQNSKSPTPGYATSSEPVRNTPYQSGYTGKYVDPINDLKISKGKTDSNDPNGNQIYQGPNANKIIPGISEYVKTTLSNNRFDSASKMIETEDVSKPDENYDPTVFIPKYGKLRTSQLAQVGNTLMMRSGKELNSSQDGYNPTSFGAEAGALLPGTAQIGMTRVPLEELDVNDVLKALVNNESSDSPSFPGVPDSAITSIMPKGSWGSLNNPHDPFSGITSVGMIALSVLLTTSVLLVFEGLSLVLGTISGTKKVPAKVSSGAYAFGSSTISKGEDPNNKFFGVNTSSSAPLLDVNTLIGINPTVHNFADCLDRGVVAFFGGGGSGVTGINILNTAQAAVDAPGYNVVVARAIIRSSTTILDSIGNVGGSSNPLNAAKNVLNVVETLKKSKLIGAINVFTQIGDQILSSEDEDIAKGRETLRWGEKNESSAFPDNIDAVAMKKGRLSNSLKRAWASNRTTSMYLTPTSTAFLGMVSGLDGGDVAGKNMFYKERASLVKRHPGYVSAQAQQYVGRIPIEEVRKIEAELESDYMPFYFHDLRTNEIISFHAFINSFSDGFTPNWTAIEGIGRMDPVQIYKNTTRSISIAFTIVATSEADHYDMWEKINKLVTLVYPQWTKGRRLTTSDDKKITMPFSQLQGASPLIRLRLGDMLTSNYSRFALARLFGADTGEMKLSENAITLNAVDILQKVAKKVETVRKNASPEYTWLMMPATLKESDGNKGLALAGVSDSSGTSSTFNVNPSDVRFFTFKIVSAPKDSEDQSIDVTPQIMSASEITSNFGIASTDEMIRYLNNEYNNPGATSKKVVGGRYRTNASSLYPSNETYSKLKLEVLQESNNPSQESINQLNSFMSGENNALVKVFETYTGGKGLAGKLGGLSFTFDEYTWETKPGSRAPKMCKVQFEFTPIHDIAPGIDSNGFDRAPVYSIGRISSTDSDTAGVR